MQDGGNQLSEQEEVTLNGGTINGEVEQVKPEVVANGETPSLETPAIETPAEETPVMEETATVENIPKTPAIDDTAEITEETNAEAPSETTTSLRTNATFEGTGE